jgi:hypothetical protein
VTWDPNANGDVNALVVSAGTVYAGGAFTQIGAALRDRIARLYTTSGGATAWNPGANGVVNALAVDGGTTYAGGAFTQIGSATRNRIAALDGGSGLATAWDPNANGNVNALAIDGTTVYAGGAFTQIGGATRNRIAALDATLNTNSATAWNPNANGNVNALLVSGSTVYAGGAFSAIGGLADRIAALDVGSGQASNWSPSINSTVLAIAAGGIDIIAGGQFSTVANLQQANVTRLHGTGVVAVPGSANDVVTPLALGRPSPNPASNLVRIEYALPQPGQTRISVYDLQGRLVARPLDVPRPAGRQTLIWDAGSLRLGAGLYFLRLEQLGRRAHRTLVLLN